MSDEMQIALIVMIVGLALIGASKVMSIVQKKDVIYSYCVVGGAVLGILVAILFLCGVGETHKVLMTVLCALFVALGVVYIVFEIIFIVKTIKKMKTGSSTDANTAVADASTSQPIDKN